MITISGISIMGVLRYLTVFPLGLSALVIFITMIIKLYDLLVHLLYIYESLDEINETKIRYHSVTCILGYARVYLLLHNVRDTAFHLQVDDSLMCPSVVVIVLRLSFIL